MDVTLLAQDEQRVQARLLRAEKLLAERVEREIKRKQREREMLDAAGEDPEGKELFRRFMRQVGRG